MSSSFDRDKFREEFRRTEKRDPTGREWAEARRAYGGERRYQERMERKTGKDVDEDKLAMDAALAAARPHVFDGETEADRGGGTQKKFPYIPGRDPFVIPVDNTRTGVAENKDKKTLWGGENLGGGSEVFKEYISGTAGFRTLVAGDNVEVEEDGDTIKISCTCGSSSSSGGSDGSGGSGSGGSSGGSEGSGSGGSSSGGSEGSGSGSSSGGSEGSGSGGSSWGSSSGSDKSTAIVPASWTKTGYAALFIAEMPEVRFDDVLVVDVAGRVTSMPIDSRFIEVCQKDSILACGAVPDRPALVGAVVEQGRVVVMCPQRKRDRPSQVVVRLTGIRKGFSGKRFPARTKAQFTANEKFINSAYPAA